MKVDLKKKDVLFVVYFGKYFLINKSSLCTSLVYRSSLIFDENGIITKAAPYTTMFIQDYVNSNGSDSLLQLTKDLTEFTKADAKSILLSHKNSVITYYNHIKELDLYVSKVEKVEEAKVSKADLVKLLMIDSGFGSVECKNTLQRFNWDIETAKRYLVSRKF